MSRIMFSILLLLMIVVAAAQTKTEMIMSRDDYLNKSKQLKATGYVLVTVGVAATVIGIVMSNAADPGPDAMALEELDKLPGLGLTIAGVTTALVSIHYFSKAAKYERKAAELSFGNRKMISPFQPDFIARSQPTITVKIKF